MLFPLLFVRWFGLVWFESLAIIPHSQLSRQQWRFCKLHNAKCLGSEGMWDEDFSVSWNNSGTAETSQESCPRKSPKLGTHPMWPPLATADPSTLTSASASALHVPLALRPSGPFRRKPSGSQVVSSLVGSQHRVVTGKAWHRVCMLWHSFSVLATCKSPSPDAG